MKTKYLSNKNILLGVTGSIAAYKACEVVRLLINEGANVKVIMTRNAERFVSKLTFQTLSRNRVISEMFNDGESWVPEHIKLSEWADVILVAPATANIIGKARAGIADDLLSSALISAECKIVFAPAMNNKMYGNKAVQGGIAELKERGCYFIGPEEGFLADGYKGKGRMSEPETIVEHVNSVIEED